MRKYLALMLLVLCTLLCTAAQADTFTFADISAACEIPGDKYTILTPENLSSHESWLSNRSLSPEQVLEDWKERGVLLQAWTSSGDACLEISAVQDELARQYYDVNQVNEEERKTYRLGHSADKNGLYRAEGYDYESATWQNLKKSGRFLQLKYTRTTDGVTTRGYARKTIRNGYTIHLDYQVFGRGLKSTDQKALDAVIKTWEFTEVFPRPAVSVSALIFSAKPPAETNTGKFTVSGTGATGLHVVGTVMRMSASDAHQFETTIGKTGKFELDVKLPAEGYWVMTYTVENAGAVVEEGAFEPITYQKNLLPVTLNSELPTQMELTGNELVISGTTMKHTKVQCIVDGRNFSKQITTNNSGKFSFTLDTSEEGAYTITLVLEKKGYATRRFRCDASRTFTAEDQREAIRTDAVKPAYKTLKEKIAGYTGRYMVYNLYVRSVEPTSSGFISFCGMSRTKAGVYKDVVVVRCSDDPTWVAGDQVKMYLRCIGTYEMTTDDGVTEYPYFDLQFTE